MKDNFIILEGKNLDALIQEGMRKLNADKDQIDVQVLENKKSLFGSHVKIKVSLKASKAIDSIEKSIENIYKDSLGSQLIQNKKDIELIYNSDGVYVKLKKILPIEEIKQKVELKRISNVSYEALEIAL
ncbi:MAG: hypothetical protein K0R84_2797, partial [Clostridia bacterium]|nr:hypothetical protein [Clostridia bacterium]